MLTATCLNAHVIRNSKVLAYVHIVLLICLKEKHTRFARRIDELNRELENALQSYSLQLTEAFARNF